MPGLARSRGAPEHSRIRRVAGAVAAAVVVGLVAGCAATQGMDAGEQTPDASSPESLGQAFLADWVDDGRVVRRDQGDDTVSEGQAYGMLIAAGTGDEESFDAIWGWTQDNLVRPDGLLAWRWDDGAVVDDEPASDADLDAARALVVAGERFDRDDYTTAGDALAATVLDELTVTTASGRILLPGLWAAGGEPWAYNPSYASPATFSVLGESTGDPRWAELTEGSRAVTAALLAKSPLPSDWAQVHADGTVDQMPGARGGGDPVQYAYDAARLPIRYAESCEPADTALAGDLASALDQSPEVAARLDLGGAPQTSDEHPVGYVARAAALASAGDDADATADVDRAAQLAESQPTYYGAAWAALASLMLETDSLGGCPPLASGTEAAAVTDASAAAASGLQDPQAAQGAGVAEAAPIAPGVAPVRVQIPSIGVDSGLESLTRDASGWIQPPADFGSAGWYRDGVVPGRVGPAVIAGHIDSAVGPAVFYDLSTLAPGDEVSVTLSDGSTATFAVTHEIQVPKEQFPTDEVYGPTPDSELRLVTCGGVFDDSYGHYVDNVVVFATRTA